MKIGLIIFSLVTILSCNQTTNYSELYFSAKESSKSGNYAEAIKLLNKTVKLQPAIDSIYVERAYNYYKLKEHKIALVDINKAININFNNVKAYLLKGMIYKEMYDYENALKAYTHIIFLEDSIYLDNALLERANVYFSTGQYDNSINDLSDLIERDSLNYEAYVNRGIARQGVTKKTIFFDENNSKELFKLLNIDYKEGNNKEGINKTNWYEENESIIDFNKAIKINPNDAYAFVNRARLYASFNLDTLALQDINKAIIIEEESDYYVTRGLINKSLKKIKASLDDFNKAIEINPQNGIAFANRAFLKESILNDKKGAEKDFKKAKKYGVDIDEFD